MRLFKSTILSLVALIIIGGTVWFIVYNYSFLFSRTVTGLVRKIELRDINVSLLQQQGSALPSQLFSCAVAVQDAKGEIFTASCEDRQWGVVSQGECVEAVFYPYPPWNFQKSGTYFNARLRKQFDCPEDFPFLDRVKKAAPEEPAVEN